ncbi:cAMP and cAMP-inhibited cGMP 3',5'-cyclic phosphodiesterase 10A-like [Amphiura filiformis]|uniref:cAMP and cAMP-inhibited cGMP 3',5'-cyclic phosphodiesterase 10A-like n=1 Tax=Amphiura filiformis TaxID=82378 RepID=UPI003B21810D
MMVKGHGTSLSNGFSRYQRHLLNNHHQTAEPESLPEPVIQEQVKHYLTENPAFLEDYVLSHVHSEELERWLHILQGHRLRPSNSASKEGATGRSLSVASTVHGPTSPRPKKCKKQKNLPSQEKHQERRKLIFDLTQDVHQFSSRARILDQLAQSISTTIGADNYTLYLVNKNGTDLYEHKGDQDLESDAEPSQTWTICKGQTIAGFVANAACSVNTTTLTGGDKHPEGIAVKDVTANAVLGVPLQQSNDDVIGVLEFYKSEAVPFLDREEELAGIILLWGSLAVYYATVRTDNNPSCVGPGDGQGGLDILLLKNIRPLWKT